MITELVKFQNTTGLFLDGLYFYHPSNNSCVIHIHGSFGNFYSNSFIKTMADTYTGMGINFLSFNLTQHDGIAEAVREQGNELRWEYIGYCLSDYASCIDDINGAINFAKKRSNTFIILQGHSLGCNRVLLFLKETGNNCPAVLLSPTNSLELQRRWIYPEDITHQLSRLCFEGLNNHILMEEHGVNTIANKVNLAYDDAPYIPISSYALVQMFTNPSMDIVQMLNAEEPVKNPAFIYLGGNDEYQTDPIEKYEFCFDRYFSETTFKIINNGNHAFTGYEQELSENIAEWIRKIKSRM